MPKHVAASIPKQVQMPIAFMAAAPAPEAKTSGITPKMKLHAVIMTARKRSDAPLTAESYTLTPSSRCCLENSTIKIAFLAASAISITHPSCA